MRHVVIASAFSVGIAVIACGGGTEVSPKASRRPEGHVTDQSGPGVVVAPTESDAGSTVAPSVVDAAPLTTGSTTSADDAAAPSVSGPKACGCSLCEPLVSDDPCKLDSDCGPSLPCHADACVAKSKSHPMKAGDVCTQIMKCTTADANKCGCYQGKCALVPPAVTRGGDRGGGQH
jgi:hypothetical protein